MSRQILLSIALLLMLAAFPLISFGTSRNRPALWWSGLAALGIGGLIPPVSRYVFQEGNNNDENNVDNNTDRDNS